jgi:hypothetical protein
MNRLAGARTETFLGLHSRGFPNLFIVTGPQGGCGSFNYHDEYVRTPEGWKCQSLKVMGLFFTPHDSGWVKPASSSRDRYNNSAAGSSARGTR